MKEEHRDGAKVIKRYHRLATPYQRLLTAPRTPEETRRQLTAFSLTLDPMLLLRDMRLAQERLVAIADTPGGKVAVNDAALPLETIQLQPVRRFSEIAAELRSRTDVESLCRRRQIAVGHVLDHAAAKRTQIGRLNTPV